MTGDKVTITISNPDTTRSCGGCTLCCRLLPVHGDLRVNGVDLPGNFYKRAGERCPHQRFKKGCAVYNKPGMPKSCKHWNCRWLTMDDTADLHRPDRVHYVLDVIPDYITLNDPDDPVATHRDIPVIQVWVDPAFPEAWRDPALLAYLDRRGRDGYAALIRYDAKKAFTLLPPSLVDGQWHEIRNGTSVPERPLAEFISKFGS